MGSRQSKGPTLEEALRILSPGEQADLSAAFDQLTADKTNSKPKTKEQAEMFDFAAFKVKKVLECEIGGKLGGRGPNLIG